MSPKAKSTLAEAQESHAAARAAVDALHQRLDSGDATVTGTALTKANADLEVAGRLLAVAEADAANEAAEEARLAATAAVGHAVAVHQETSADLAAAIEDALDATERLANVAATHQATTEANRGAAVALGGLIARLPAPDPEAVVVGVQALAFQRVGISVDHLHPHLLLEPLAPFLPAGS